ncbi:hypothetical protein SAMN04487912_105186 [Arthrobacter sp. cf158]|nr:hypothetical protein SAMN04487912_105186 [Arthrobacter sp. cf158]
MTPENSTRTCRPPVRAKDHAGQSVVLRTSTGTPDCWSPWSHRANDTKLRAGADTEDLETGGGRVFVGTPFLQQVTEASLTFLRERMGSELKTGLDPAIRAMEKEWQRLATSRYLPMSTVLLPAQGGPTSGQLQSSTVLRRRVDRRIEVSRPGWRLQNSHSKPQDASDASVVYFHGESWTIGDLDGPYRCPHRRARRAGGLQVRTRKTPPCKG